MKLLRTPTIILILLYLCFLGCWAWSGSQLPGKVATHFNGSGEPDGWMSRSTHQNAMLIFGLAFPLFIVLLCYTTRFLPASLVNIPNRDYWLAPEKRKETSSYVVRMSLWIACLAIGFIMGIQYLTVQANQQTPPQLSTPGILALAGCFVAGTVVSVVIMVRHFKLTKP